MKATKIIVVLLLAILLLSTLACGGGEGEEEAATPTPTPTPTPSPTPSVGAEGEAPTLNVGDRWVYDITSDGKHYTWTEEVTGQETIGGKDCYVLAISDNEGEPVLELAIEKETLRPLRLRDISGQAIVPYESFVNYSYEGPPLFPLEVGKEGEITQTSTTTTTIEGDTQTSTSTDFYTFKVEKIEDITVAAGTFTCFKIVNYDEYGSPAQTLWYSDKAKTPTSRGVKFIDHETGETLMELQSYSVR